MPGTIVAVAYLLTSRSALRFWLRVESSIDAVSTACKIGNPKLANHSLSKEALADFISMGLGPRPVHLITDAKHRRHPTKSVVCHQWGGSFSAGSFRKVAPDVFVASPELCFLTMAKDLSLTKLVELGFAFCGTYTVLEEKGLITDRGPLTNTGKLANYIKRCETLRGYSKAKKAIALVCNNSASPQETKLAMALSFPVRAGGYGFPKPVMNYRVDYSPEEQALYGKSHVVLDLYWPQWKLGIEYDGRDYHGDSDAIARDRQKSSEMATKSIEIVRVDRSQVCTPKHIYVLAKKIGRITKAYVSEPSESQWKNKVALFKNLYKR